MKEDESYDIMHVSTYVRTRHLGYHDVIVHRDNAYHITM